MERLFPQPQHGTKRTQSEGGRSGRPSIPRRGERGVRQRRQTRSAPSPAPRRKFGNRLLGIPHRVSDNVRRNLGRLQFEDYELVLAPNFKPVHTKPYPVARRQEQNVKDKIQQLINDDVVKQIYDSEMASPAFFLVKSDGSLRILVDFRWLNKYLRRAEILMRLASAKCMSTFDD
ncbi:Pol protein [Phytophthora palmivora]|uniref:Pol protein n=1 Tax=Phytophthora palmivora TaxID=4796 RepID=A0A2P4Y1U2_9STRA|nr:Pol protein [Phytophthora palmivora]